MNLSELISTHRGGRSYAELARDAGGSPSAKRLQQLVTQPMKNFPDPPTVRALARGLKVPQSAVVLAAAESLGLEVDRSPSRLLELLPARTSMLTEQEAAAVAHLVRTVLDTHYEHEPAPSVPSEPGYDDGPEPTVLEVLAARDRADLRAVAESGDPSDAERVDELARKARERQTGDETE